MGGCGSSNQGSNIALNAGGTGGFGQAGTGGVPIGVGGLPAGVGGAGTACASSATCAAPTPYCNAGVCVECLGDANCMAGAGGPVCSPVTHTCVACATDANCVGASGTPYCKTTTGTCVQCLARANCGSPTLACDPASNRCVTTCTSSANCAVPTPYCDTTLQICVECLGDANCAGAQGGPACNTTTHQCVECLTDANCAIPTPYCSANRCVECLTNANCAGSACNAGQCGGPVMCPIGQRDCGAGCVDVLTNIDNCGACGDGCNPASESCVAGRCECTSGGTTCAGAGCVDLSHDPNNCGTCGNTCGDREACIANNCVCRPGLTDCGGTCVDLQSDPNHCGACSGGTAVCTGTQQCSAGMCGASGGGCSGGLTQCPMGGNLFACVDTNTSPLDCGACDNRCARDEVCVQGECRAFQPAVTCATCPCTAVCSAVFGGGSTCCTGVNSNPGPTCVDTGNCP
jgi:hypothetical protein